MNFKLLVIVLLLCPLSMMGQQTKVGVRAGLDFVSVIGPQEANETNPFSTGFHFGINVSRYLSNNFGIRAELVYQQKGFRKEYNGTGYYPIMFDGSLYFEEGNLDYVLEVSNAYVSLPLTVHIQPIRQLEFFAGISANFLINPVGSGRVDYTSNVNPERFFFRQTLGYSYNSDTAGSRNTATIDPVVFIGEDLVTVPGSVGAYYLFDNADKLFSFRRFDVSAVLGTQIYVNKSFYIGIRGEYGLTDLTIDDYDVSLENTSPTGGLQLNADKDHQLAIELSVGFRF